MIELVVIYCLKATPSHCIERRDPMTDYPSFEACTTRAEIAAEQYLAGHPKWMLSRWHCEMDKPQEDPA